MQLTESGLPASVQYLAGVDQLFIKQKIEMLEVLTGFETRNRYAVLNKEMQQVFFVQEVPMDMTVECKMLMVAATFLIEFYVFEQQKKNNNSDLSLNLEQTVNLGILRGGLERRVGIST
ncbi:PLS1-like protein [Mya arenaria]|nr:PLS1-like protein [Mya arenaria]